MLYIFKGIIYKTFCLLNVFLFVMQLFSSTCCDVPQLDFFLKNYIQTVDCFCFLKDTDTQRTGLPGASADAFLLSRASSICVRASPRMCSWRVW